MIKAQLFKFNNEAQHQALKNQIEFSSNAERLSDKLVVLHSTTQKEQFYIVSIDNSINKIISELEGQAISPNDIIRTMLKDDSQKFLFSWGEFEVLDFLDRPKRA
jgi:hypothetical protein